MGVLFAGIKLNFGLVCINNLTAIILVIYLERLNMSAPAEKPKDEYINIRVRSTAGGMHVFVGIPSALSRYPFVICLPLSRGSLFQD